MRERDIQGKVVGYARRQGVIARKLDFGAGWPDYMFLHMGEVLFIEFKQPGEKPKPLQQFVHGLLRNHDFKVRVVDDVTTGMDWIDQFIAQPVNS
jgi:hypothetical protein